MQLVVTGLIQANQCTGSGVAKAGHAVTVLPATVHEFGRHCRQHRSELHVHFHSPVLWHQHQSQIIANRIHDIQHVHFHGHVAGYHGETGVGSRLDIDFFPSSGKDRHIPGLRSGIPASTHLVCAGGRPSRMPGRDFQAGTGISPKTDDR